MHAGHSQSHCNVSVECWWCFHCVSVSCLVCQVLECYCRWCVHCTNVTCVSGPWVLMLMMCSLHQFDVCVRSIHIQHRWHVVFQWLHSRWYCHTSEDAQECTVCKWNTVSASLRNVLSLRWYGTSQMYESQWKKYETRHRRLPCQCYCVWVCEMLTKMLFLTICDFLLVNNTNLHPISQHFPCCHWLGAPLINLINLFEYCHKSCVARS